MSVSRWFKGWFKRHCDLNRYFEVPDSGSDQFTVLIDLWQSDLAKMGATFEVASMGSEWIAGEDVPPHLHWPKLKAKIRDILRDEYGNKPPVTAERAEVEKTSKSCPDCNGTGMAIRYRHHGADAGSRVAFYCLCDHGRFLRDAQRASAPDVADRVPDLADHPRLHLRPVGVGEWDHPNCYRPGGAVSPFTAQAAGVA